MRELWLLLWSENYHGMAAKVLPPGKKPQKPNDVIQQIKVSKEVEIRCGVDGFLIYDVRIKSKSIVSFFIFHKLTFLVQQCNLLIFCVYVYTRISNVNTFQSNTLKLVSTRAYSFTGRFWLDELMAWFQFLPLWTLTPLWTETIVVITCSDFKRWGPSTISFFLFFLFRSDILWNNYFALEIIVSRNIPTKLLSHIFR